MHANADGGWGDTTSSRSNISTTTLVWAAFGAVPGADDQYRAVVRGAEQWLTSQAGNLTPARLAAAILERYGHDRTFSVPILTMCALGGRLGPNPAAWQDIIPLPFELAVCPHQLFGALRLPVVSYALPALIAMGQARHYHLPSANLVVRAVRNATRRRTLEVLRRIQPSSGGFLEATPLTSFVVMSLAASGQVHHPVTQQGLAFLRAAARPDGSWPIDTNLATWLTTLAVDALAATGAVGLSPDEQRTIRVWLLNQQYQVEHPYTHAAPGGWAWTDLPGGVPDADDTAGALLALRRLGPPDAGVRRAVEAAVTWLLNLQNRDGGIPTFCRGWGHLPFDRSSPDLTAHALRAWLAWLDELNPSLQKRARRAVAHAFRYLAGAMRADGSWTPLWFGNERAPDEANPTYGTARVLSALATSANRPLGEEASPGGQGSNTGPNRSARPPSDSPNADHDIIARGDRLRRAPVAWLLSAQNRDGSWSGFPGGEGSVEETALALDGLAAHLGSPAAAAAGKTVELRDAVAKGADYLIRRIEDGSWRRPSPIGLYFARLWYWERLYPVIFTAGALGQVARALP
jgi:squalene-hopene/tetraprenyl-beta-curcumene cyclase